MLKSGDHISGKLLRDDPGEISIETDFAGIITVHKSFIDKVLNEKEQTEAKAARERAAEEIDIWNVSLGNEKYLWSGLLDTGLTASRGNAEVTTFSFSGSAIRKTDKDRLSVNLTSLYGRTGTVGQDMNLVDSTRAGIDYNRDFTPRTFGAAGATFEYDEFQQLDLRSVLALSVGRHVIKTSRAILDIAAGATANREMYATGLKRTTAEALFSDEFNYRFSKLTTFHQKLVVFPNLSLPGQFRFNFDASTHTSLNRWLGWQVTFSDRYASNPVLNTRKNDLQLTTGLRFYLRYFKM